MISPLLATLAMAPPTPFSALIRVPLPSLTLGRPTEPVLVSPGFDWDEAIVSWNVANSERATLKVEVQVREKWYVLASWSGDMSKASRTSIPKQKDESGEVQTDVLHLNQPADALNLRLTLDQTSPGAEPKLKLVTVCFSNAKSLIAEKDGAKKVGKVLEPPRQGQAPYESGKLKYDPTKVNSNFEAWFKSVKGAQYCSPTSVSMVLGFWADQLSRKDLKVDVPEVVTGVFDEKYPGTGNWPFNAAYMGAFDGMRSYITRLRSIQDLEILIDGGIPVICSVAHNLLLGNGKPAGGDGHLVVLVGFNQQGNPVFNDPGKADEVRRTFKRENFRKAWNISNRTVYICHPEGMKLPELSETSILRG